VRISPSSGPRESISGFHMLAQFLSGIRRDGDIQRQRSGRRRTDRRLDEAVPQLEFPALLGVGAGQPHANIGGTVASTGTAGPIANVEAPHTFRPKTARTA
jgi:hypothetical protein